MPLNGIISSQNRMAKIGLSFTSYTLPGTLSASGIIKGGTNNRIIIVPQSGGTGYESTNGTSWTSLTFPSSISCQNPAANSSILVFAYDPGYPSRERRYYSSNGSSWTYNTGYWQTAGATQKWFSSIGNFVLMAGANASERSTSGSTYSNWSANLYSVYNGTESTDTVIWPYYGSDYALKTTTSTWTGSAAVSIGTSKPWYNAVYGGGVWVVTEYAGSGGGAGGADAMVYSTSSGATTWTLSSVAKMSGQTTPAYSSAYGSGCFVITGYGKYLFSKTGTSDWAALDLPTNDYYFVLYDSANSRFVFFANGTNKVYTAVPI